MMKKIIILFLITAILLLSVTMTFAGGDQVRGAKAKGQAYQHQVMAPPPFQPRSLGLVLYQTSWDGTFICLYSK